MDATPLFLLLLLPPADTTGDGALGIQASLRRELGDVAMAVAPDTLVTPAMLKGDTLRARFVARVSWTTKDKAKVELLPSTGGASRTRTLGFAPQDSKLERGRAIGLALAELLREAPAAAFAAPVAGARLTEAPPPPPSRFAPSAWFAAERVRSGNWAMGPMLGSSFALSPAWRLEAFGQALFGTADRYFSIGFGVVARWDFLRATNGASALGIGLGWEVFRESAGADPEAEHNASLFSLGLDGSLAGRVAVWRSLRLVGEAKLQAAVRAISLTVGEDISKRTYSYSHWRPAFALGLELPW